LNIFSVAVMIGTSNCFVVLIMTQTIFPVKEVKIHTLKYESFCSY